MIFRKAENELKNWLLSTTKEALLVDGARQIGKSFLIRYFLNKSQCDFIELNLYENLEAKDIFDSSTNTKDLVLKLSLLVKKEFVPGKTIIFIDEIQEADDVLTKIKFLVEDGSYRFILSGSVLGVELRNIRSLPVGYLKIVHMFPCDFEEFCIANGVSNQILDLLKKSFVNKTSVDYDIHNQMLKLFNLYLIIGGLPQAIQVYLDSNNLQKVFQVHNIIDESYRVDISKYDKKDSLLIKDIYDLIAPEVNQINKRFILKKLNEKIRFYQYEESFVWLKNSNIGLFTYNIDNPIYPLLVSKDRKLFKLFLCDCGLLSHKLFDNSAIKILNGETDVNFGALFENVVAQE